MTRPALLAALPFALSLAGCAATTHQASSAVLGSPRPASSMEALVDQPGPLSVETVKSADWEVPRSGLINLKHPKAIEAGLKDGPEPVIIAFHAIRHPQRGLYLVDSGFERAQAEDPGNATIRAPVSWAMNASKLKISTPTAAWVARQPSPPQGVFLTHLHLDHVSGMRDLPPSTVVFAGPGESQATDFMHLFTQGTTDAELSGKATVQQWRFAPDTPDAPFEGALDVFGDGSLWALWVPGHTPGSTAYLARTPQGPVLLTGDACHTAWGWRNGVEPGTFSHDQPRSARSLERLRAFAARHPAMAVRLGHQDLLLRGDAFGGGAFGGGCAFGEGGRLRREWRARGNAAPRAPGRSGGRGGLSAAPFWPPDTPLAPAGRAGAFTGVSARTSAIRFPIPSLARPFGSGPALLFAARGERGSWGHEPSVGAHIVSLGEPP